MRIVGCELHARQQTLAKLDPTVGEMLEAILNRECHGAREFYSTLPRPGRVEIEGTGSMRWFSNSTEELGIDCMVGHSARIRAVEAKGHSQGSGAT